MSGRLGLRWVALLGWLTRLHAAPVTGYMFGKGVYFADVSTDIYEILSLATILTPLLADDVQGTFVRRLEPMIVLIRSLNTSPRTTATLSKPCSASKAWSFANIGLSHTA